MFPQFLFPRSNSNVFTSAESHRVSSVRGSWDKIRWLHLLFKEDLSTAYQNIAWVLWEVIDIDTIKFPMPKHVLMVEIQTEQTTAWCPIQQCATAFSSQWVKLQSKTASAKAVSSTIASYCLVLCRGKNTYLGKWLCSAMPTKPLGDAWFSSTLLS